MLFHQIHSNLTLVPFYPFSLNSFIFLFPHSSSLSLDSFSCSCYSFLCFLFILLFLYSSSSSLNSPCYSLSSFSLAPPFFRTLSKIRTPPPLTSPLGSTWPSEWPCASTREQSRCLRSTTASLRRAARVQPTGRKAIGHLASHGCAQLSARQKTQLTKIGWLSEGDGNRKSSSASVSGVEARGEGRSPEEKEEEGDDDDEEEEG